MARKNRHSLKQDKFPVTQAIRALRAAKVDFTQHLYTYEEHGGTAVCARELGIDEHAAIKTIVFETDTGAPLIVLMHGDREVSAKSMARILGTKTVTPLTPAKVTALTGYMVGGTSPFGTRRPVPVYMEKTILDLPGVYINGGKRGFILGMDPADIVRVLDATPVEAAMAG